MDVLRISADIPEDRQLILHLPPETPTGRAEIIIQSVARSEASGAPFRTSLADWAEENAEDWGDAIRSDDVSTFTGREF